VAVHGRIEDSGCVCCELWQDRGEGGLR
jgi:hypothetical protein